MIAVLHGCTKAAAHPATCPRAMHFAHTVISRRISLHAHCHFTHTAFARTCAVAFGAAVPALCASNGKPAFAAATPLNCIWKSRNRDRPSSLPADPDVARSSAGKSASAAPRQPCDQERRRHDGGQGRRNCRPPRRVRQHHRAQCPCLWRPCLVRPIAANRCLQLQLAKARHDRWHRRLLRPATFRS